MSGEKRYPVRYRRNGGEGDGFFEVLIGGPDRLRAIAFMEEGEDGRQMHSTQIAIVGEDPNLAWRYESFAPAVEASIILAEEDKSAFSIAPFEMPK